jgi:hypothetical protein
MAKCLASRDVVHFAIGCIAAAFFLNGAAHAITDTVFRYSPPKQGYLSLDSAGFTPLTSAAADAYAVFYVYDGFISTTAAGSCFGTSVNLPEAAKVTAVTTWYQAGARVSLYRHKPSDATSAVLADKTFTGDPSSLSRGNVAITNPALQAVDNQLYSYALIVCLPQTTDYFFGARVAYTYTTAGD